MTSHTPRVNLASNRKAGEGVMENKIELIESIVEQNKDAINILQLLEIELSGNQDDENILRTVSIIKKMLQSNAEKMQQLNCCCENNRQ